jgi:hypothetical protein
VSLYLSLFPWAAFRRTKGGIKLHTLLDHDGYCPLCGPLPGSGARNQESPQPQLTQGLDCCGGPGLHRLCLVHSTHRQKIFFVTRQKRNARYAVLEHRQVKKNQGGGIFTKSLNLGLSVFISLLNSWNFFYGSNCWNLISVLPSGTGAGTIAGPRKQRL